MSGVAGDMVAGNECRPPGAQGSVIRRGLPGHFLYALVNFVGTPNPKRESEEKERSRENRNKRDDGRRSHSRLSPALAGPILEPGPTLRTRDLRSRPISRPSPHLKDCSDCRPPVMRMRPLPVMHESAPHETETWCLPFPRHPQRPEGRPPQRREICLALLPHPSPHLKDRSDGRPPVTPPLPVNEPVCRITLRLRTSAWKAVAYDHALSTPSIPPRAAQDVQKDFPVVAPRAERLCDEDRLEPPLRKTKSSGREAPQAARRCLPSRRTRSLQKHLGRTKSTSCEALSSGTTASPLSFAIIAPAPSRDIGAERRGVVARLPQAARRRRPSRLSSSHPIFPETRRRPDVQAARADPPRWTSALVLLVVFARRR
ncbi:hypothetical protein K438DRAFT_1781029 [Mycena galopus ATCC 62051]|nr:hypothetical protein K438DRAFT_1781029 [Mycena galopus ATCC 62051]